MEVRRVPMEQLVPLLEEQLDHGSARLPVTGSSMLPMLRGGRDVVSLVRLTQPPQRGDVLLYRRENGQYVLHRVIRAGSAYTCMGDNQFAPEPGVGHDQVIALVTAFSRDGREYSVHSPAYWFYCRLWHFSRPVRRLWRRGRSLLRRLKK